MQSLCRLLIARECVPVLPLGAAVEKICAVRLQNQPTIQFRNLIFISRYKQYDWVFKVAAVSGLPSLSSTNHQVSGFLIAVLYCARHGLTVHKDKWITFCEILGARIVPSQKWGGQYNSCKIFKSGSLVYITYSFVNNYCLNEQIYCLYFVQAL